MRTGDMDRRITLQQATVTYDALNNPTQTWTDLATVWAAKMDLSAMEQVASREVGAEMTTVFQIRYSQRVADINPKDRLTFNDRTYEIVNVKEIGRREGLEISAVARIDS